MPHVVAVLVSYHPDLDQIRELVARLAPQVSDLIIVDNGSGSESVESLTSLTNTNTHVHALKENIGIAAAQNIGISLARELRATHVLLSDDDSRPAPDMVVRLLSVFEEAGDTRLAAVGPITVDKRTGSAPLVFTDQGTGPKRIRSLPSEDGAKVDVAFLIASGCLIDVRALDEIGPMNDRLFIDHVDLEWGVRARNAGWRLVAVVGATLHHSLGETTRRVPGRARSVHLQTPTRNYFMVRNTIFLVRSELFPSRWRSGYRRWITKYVAYYLLAVPPRGDRARLMWSGWRDGRANRLGPLPANLVRFSQH